MMTLQAEVMELKASPTAKPRGTVIEAQVEAGRGPTATVIVQMGTLRVGDAFICGDYSGKVKSLIDDRGQPVKSAGPSTPRSEEHTSELQSQSNLVCRLLLEKKT